MTLKKRVTLDGERFSSLEGFFDEVEARLTNGLSWKIGRNLNAYNDVLRGGFGVHKYGERIQLFWIHSAKSKKDLGQKETLKYLKHVLTQCHPTGLSSVKKDIEKLKGGKGTTLFDMIIDITRGHDNVELRIE